jgi:hypothetical protein
MAHLFSKAPALECAVLEVPTRSDKFWSEDMVRLRVELALLAGRLAPEDREAAGVPVVEDLDDLGALV